MDEAAHYLRELNGGGGGKHVAATLERMELGPRDLLRGPPSHLTGLSRSTSPWSTRVE